MGISSERVHNILHQHLGMKKLSARWVPRLLTVDHKRNRVRCSKDCLQLFQRNPQDFRCRFVTVDETWIHHYTPETKEQSKQWIASGESAPKKAKIVPSAGKVMATVFWDSQGVILIDYMEKGETNRCILFIVIGPFENRAARKTSTIGSQQSPFPSR